MNRRAFLTRFGIGLSAAAVLSQIPEPVLAALSVEDAGKRSALAYLTHIWNREMKGRGSGWCQTISVGPGLWKAFKGELIDCQRFAPVGDRPNECRLAFKSGKIGLDPTLRAWDSRWVFTHKEQPSFGSFWDGDIEVPTSGFQTVRYEFHRNTEAHITKTCSCSQS